MNIYRISYDYRRYFTMQRVAVQVRAQRYAIDGDTLTLFNTSPNGEINTVASFKNWSSITKIPVVQE